MYHPSSASANSSQGSMASSTTTGGGGGLMRYDSAPSSLLNTAVDSVIGGATGEFSSFGTQTPTRFFPSEPSESSARPNLNNHSVETNSIGLQRSSYGFNPTGGGGASSSSLVRHSSSPAGFLNKLATAAAADKGFSITKGIGSYNTKGANDNSQGLSRLNSQLSFTRQETLSRIFEETEGVERKINNSYSNTGFAMGSWDDTNQIMFAGSSSKRAKIISSNVNGLQTMESQFQFNMPEAALEMATIENLLHIPQDSIACKIRAKRGFATHPRSIAERERRTRISGKLKILQDLVPNMDKQTSYSDMLDLAVHHIKSLQNQLQKLNHELESCTCGCKNNT